MNKADKELFETLERDWVNYVSKHECANEIPWQAESVMAKMQIYKGDLPESGTYKPDTMPATIDAYRKFRITDAEYFAARMMFRVPRNLQKFVMLEPLIRRKEKVTQDMIAAICSCSLDQYKRGRVKAKLYWVFHARNNIKAQDVVFVA